MAAHKSEIEFDTLLGTARFVADFRIPAAAREVIEKSIAKAFEDYIPASEVQKKIKKDIDWVDTPRGALVVFMTAQGLTQKKLAKKTGINQPNISAMVNGRRPITVKTAKLLGKAFGVSHKLFL